MLTCHDVAKYFLSLTDEDSGELISNLKLQKLVYYSQGFHLALYGEPLFREEIEAWMHGPVVPELYHSFKEYGSGPIPKPVDVDFDIYPPKVKELLNDIYEVYGQFSAWKLRNLTHSEPPWINAEKSFNKEICHRSMTEFFKTQVSN